MRVFNLTLLMASIFVFDLAINEASAAEKTIVLAENCPPSFELTDEGVCRLLTQYQFYRSVQNKGLGGTQTSLPAHRDGFTPAQIDLGRFLFFDPLLSKDGSLSCASCHQPNKGFSDNLDRSIGITGEKIARSAPSLWNLAFVDKFMWDVRAKNLEEQAQLPLFDKVEMGNTPENLLATLRNNIEYKQLFADAFPASTALELSQVYTALTAFQTSLVSLNSRYDQYAHGYHQALTKNEIAGLNVFRSFVARCAECHQPPLFTNNQIAVIGSPEPDGLPFDVGAETTYEAEKLRGAFKVPTLRNITQTAPYMHSGRYKTLKETVQFYNDGRGNSVPKDKELLLHWHITDPNLTDKEVDLIVEFLGALTDESLTPQLPNRVPSGLAVVDDNFQQEQTRLAAVAEKAAIHSKHEKQAQQIKITTTTNNTNQHGTDVVVRSGE